MGKIGPSQLDDRHSDRDLFVLDIRPETDYQQGHIEGSFNAPVYDDLQRGDTDALEAYLDEIPTDKDVVTVCKAGIVAQKATTYLRDQGYDATTLTGGYTGWRHYDQGTFVYRGLSLLRQLTPTSITSSR
ncbi:rhodanese-like domain-containing protein [Halostella sp. JP-L12]|uniref:rhodanese-like domain-containing protein n=1 Tax=Halostella TaxID=1843185 RepID=UPI000EF84472|nr:MULTISPECIES: rhodanese-like domain-containing protein [Halostella]NHN49292.1 rhodanese-like domain-containing protein [Halostella sp. JP-L12]